MARTVWFSDDCETPSLEAARVKLNTVANVRIHRETHQRPIDRFEDERPHLLPPNPAGFDLARVCTASATKQFRVPLDSNHYTVPSRCAGQHLTLKALCRARVHL